MAVVSFLCFMSVAYLFSYSGITSSTTTEQNMEPASCTACCQSGIPGIPGQHGIPGSRGDDGVKGDKGDSFDLSTFSNALHMLKGEKDEVREILPGQKGIIGSPGKVGPVGSVGPVGLPGQMGSKGEKGEPAQLPPAPKSAFSVVNINSKAVNVGDILSWDQVVTNKGNDFDPTTGKFTCRVPGTYAFMFTCTNWIAQLGPVCKLTKNGDIIVGAFTGSTVHTLVSNGAAVDLVAGDQVWIEIGYQAGALYSNADYKYVTFSGYLLFAD